jgi:hypothetical protein
MTHRGFRSVPDVQHVALSHEEYRMSQSKGFRYGRVSSFENRDS